MQWGVELNFEYDAARICCWASCCIAFAAEHRHLQYGVPATLQSLIPGLSRSWKIRLFDSRTFHVLENSTFRFQDFPGPGKFDFLIPGLSWTFTNPGVRCSHLLLSTTACCLLHRTHNTATAIDRYLLPKGTQQQTRCMLPLLSIRGTDRTQRDRCSTITVLGQISFASIRGSLNRVQASAGIKTGMSPLPGGR